MPMLRSARRLGIHRSARGPPCRSRYTHTSTVSGLGACRRPRIALPFPPFGQFAAEGLQLSCCQFDNDNLIRALGADDEQPPVINSTWPLQREPQRFDVAATGDAGTHHRYRTSRGSMRISPGLMASGRTSFSWRMAWTTFRGSASG